MGNQYSRVHEFLRHHDATRLMVSIQLGIYQANICRYVRDMVKRRAAGVVRVAPCRITGERAEYLTTDPNRIPPDSQLGLFEDGVLQ